MTEHERQFRSWLAEAIRYVYEQNGGKIEISGNNWAVAVPGGEYYDPPDSICGLRIYSTYNGIISLLHSGVRSREADRAIKCFYDFQSMTPFCYQQKEWEPKQ